jgi:hypothetical protein
VIEKQGLSFLFGGHAGQGVVQFARRVDGNHCLFAIKFFADRRDYLEEVEVYHSSPLAHFMPRVWRTESNDDGSIRDPFGGPMAPFIVMEKGQSLQDRARQCRVDVFTAAQVRFFFVPVLNLVNIYS